MRVEFEVPNHAALIERILDGFIRAGELLIRAGAAGAPSLDLQLQDDDTQRFQLPNETEEKLTGDCEDLIIWWAAWLRATGKDPRASARIKVTGKHKVHCLLKLGDGKLVDAYEEHEKAQQKRGEAGAGYELAGFGSFFRSIGRGIEKGAKAVGHGVSSAASGVKHAAQYVAKDLPRDILHEAGSGLKSVAGGVADFVHDIGSAGAAPIEALGDVVAAGAQQAIHQVGKLGGAVAGSFQGGFGDDIPQQQQQQQQPDPGAQDQPPGPGYDTAEPPEFPDTGDLGDDYGYDDEDDGEDVYTRGREGFEETDDDEE